jgi:small-conductance mechanosensitive channel
MSLVQTALAQSPATPLQAAPARQDISPTDIPNRADIDERIVLDVIQRASDVNPADALQPPLDALSKSVDKLSRRYKQDELMLLPIVRLQSLERYWRFCERRADSWRAELSRASARYLEDAADLSRRSAEWRATRQTAESAGITTPLIERATAVQAQIALAEQALASPLEKQARLRELANALSAKIQAGQRMVTEAITHNDMRLSAIDAPALWEPTAQSSTDNAFDSLKAGVALESEFVTEYNAAHYWGRLIYLFSSLAVLPVLLWLNWRSRNRVTNDVELQASLHVLRRPFSSWLLLTASGVLIVASNGPIVMNQLALLCVLIPVLRLLPDRVYRALGAWPYVASVLYLLNLLGFLLLANTFLHRCHLLAVTILTLVMLLWLLLRPRQQTAAVNTSTDAHLLTIRIMRIASWIAVVILATSSIANVYGNVSLAEMLTDALLFSGYVGLALYAGANVLTSMLHLLLSRPAVARVHLIAQSGRAILRSVTRLLYTVAFIGWAIIMAYQFRILRPLQQAAAIVSDYEVSLGALSVSLGGVLLFLFSVWLAFWVAKTVRFILRDEVLPNMSLPRGVANSIASLTYYALVLLGLLTALVVAGFQIGQLTLVIGAIGVGVGLGLQNVVNNFVSGLILMFERPIQLGDAIDVAGSSGTVREIGMRATTLATFDGAEVVVPNGTLLSEKLVNWTLSNKSCRMEVKLGVAYGTPPKQVIDLLLQVAKATPGIIEKPQPAILFTGFGSNSLDFKVRAWTDNYDEWISVHSDLTLRIHDAIVAAGIEIPVPQRDLHLRSIDPDVKAALTRQDISTDTKKDGT